MPLSFVIAQGAPGGLKTSSCPSRIAGSKQRGAVLIDRFRDLAANERTWLAWVRTALAIAGFGLLIDKVSPAGTTPDWFAPVLIGLSALLLMAVTLRFHLVQRLIREGEDDSERYFSSERLLAWGALLLLLAILVFLAGTL